MTTYVVVDVQDGLESTVLGEGVKLQLIVTPKNFVQREPRTLEEVFAAALEKGFECRYAASYYGISSHRLDEIRAAVRHFLFASYGSFPRHAISIEPTATIVG